MYFSFKFNSNVNVMIFLIDIANYFSHFQSSDILEILHTIPSGYIEWLFKKQTTVWYWIYLWFIQISTSPSIFLLYFEYKVASSGKIHFPPFWLADESRKKKKKKQQQQPYYEWNMSYYESTCFFLLELRSLCFPINSRVFFAAIVRIMEKKLWVIFF